MQWKRGISSAYLNYWGVKTSCQSCFWSWTNVNVICSCSQSKLVSEHSASLPGLSHAVEDIFSRGCRLLSLLCGDIISVVFSFLVNFTITLTRWKQIWTGWTSSNEDGEGRGQGRSNVSADDRWSLVDASGCGCFGNPPVYLQVNKAEHKYISSVWMELALLRSDKKIPSTASSLNVR